MSAEPVVIAHHARTGAVALNVVTAALDADPRTRGAEVIFARDAAGVAAAVASTAVRGARPIALWSFYSTDFPVFARELGRVRSDAAVPGVLHVAGGVHATAEPRETLLAGFDLAAIGEGETTIVEIVDAVRRGADPAALRGLAHLDAGRLVSHGPGARRPLDDFPAMNLRHGKWNPIEITRGCVYACSFCQTPYVFKARFRHRSVGSVGEHVAAMRREGVRYVRFVTPTALSYGSDDTTPNLGAVEALLARVREELGSDGRIYFGTFPSECRPEHVTRDALRLLARYVDNRTLVIGGQSGSDRVLEATRRGHDVATVERAARLALEEGFTPDVDLLLGLPGEEPADRALSLQLAERLVGWGARIHGHAFMPLPGTPLRDAAPSAIEPEVRTRLAHLEAQGRLHGAWRKQIVLAADLVRRRASPE